MKHIRTIAETATWVKQQDPNSALTKTAIRGLILEDSLPHDMIGDKYLLALESLVDLIEKATMPVPSSELHDEPHIKRLRTIEGAAAWVKELDPNT